MRDTMTQPTRLLTLTAVAIYPGSLLTGVILLTLDLFNH